MYPIPQLNLVVLSPTTPGHVDPHPSIEPSDTEPYYTRSVWPLPPPSIEPSGIELYYTRSVWHMEECRCIQLRCSPSLNWTYWYRALLHQVSLTCGRMQMYPGQMFPTPIKPSGTEPYYTRSVWPPSPPSIDPSGTEPYHTRSCWSPSLNWTYWYRALLHQVSLTCGKMQTYPCQMYPQSLNWT